MLYAAVAGRYFLVGIPAAEAADSGITNLVSQSSVLFNGMEIVMTITLKLRMKDFAKRRRIMFTKDDDQKIYLKIRKEYFVHDFLRCVAERNGLGSLRSQM